MPLLLIATGLLFYSKGNSAMAAYFWGLSVLVFLLYSRYLSWRYKKHYRNYVRENLGGRFGQEVTLEITPKHISSKDPFGEGKVKTSEVHRVSETQGYFFVQLTSGMAVIIPKRGIEDVEQFKVGIKSANLKVEDDLTWQGTLTV